MHKHGIQKEVMAGKKFQVIDFEKCLVESEVKT